MRKYDVVLADPPWPYNQRANTDSFRGGACAKYNLMSIKELAAIPVADVMTKPASCFMWITGPHLFSAAELFKGWGFKYTTFAFVWVKTNPIKTDKPFFGTGHYTKANAEIILLGQRVKSAALEVVDNSISQIQEILEDEEASPFECPTYYFPRLKHSRKPQLFHGLIERLHPPSCNRLEMFARRRTPGWDCIGNEIDGRDIREALQWTQTDWYRQEQHLVYEQRLQIARVNANTRLR